MDDEERRAFIKFSLFLIVASLIIILIMYAPIRIPFLNDYYIKLVYVKFNKPYIHETIVFHVNEEKFHDLFKIYYGPMSDIISYECSDGLKPYKDRIRKEVGCRSNVEIKRGDYTLQITYKPSNVNWAYVKWVVFNDLPRKVESVKTNGALVSSSSLFGEPVVVFYPRVEIGDVIYIYLIKLFMLLPLLTPFIIIGITYYIYLKFGKEYEIKGAPSVYHTIPNPERDPVDLALYFFNNPPTAISADVISRAISSAIAHAVVVGAVEVENNRVKLVDPSKLNQLSEKEQTIIQVVCDETMSRREKGLLIYKKMKSYGNKFYDSTGEFVFGLTVVFGPVLFMMVGPFILWFLGFYNIFSEDFIKLMIAIISFELFSAIFGFFILKHLLGRYKTPEIYKEKVLWDAFKRLLDDQSRIKEYGIKDKNMWGMWLVYGFAMGVNKKSLEFISKGLASMGKTINVHRISSFSVGLASVAMPSKSSGFGGGGLGGGFSGGGSFGAR